MIGLSEILQLMAAASMPLVIFVIRQLYVLGAGHAKHGAQIKRNTEDIAELRHGVSCAE